MFFFSFFLFQFCVKLSEMFVFSRVLNRVQKVFFRRIFLNQQISFAKCETVKKQKTKEKTKTFFPCVKSGKSSDKKNVIYEI